MKNTRRLIALLLGLCLLLGLAACTSSAPADTETPTASTDAETTAPETTEETEQPADYGIMTEIAGENGTSYANLFTVILDDQYDDIWMAKAVPIVGEDAARENVDYLKGFISADIYGEEAVEAYGSDLEQLLRYMEGPYAYWLSAGIDADASLETIENVIDLFVTENLSSEE